MKGSGSVSVGAGPSRSAGSDGSGLPPSMRATGVPAAPAASYLSAAKKASAAGVPQSNKLWCKGFSRALTRETLSEQARLYVKAMNEAKGTSLPKVFAWNLEIAAALVFSDDDVAQAFFKASEGVMFTWIDMLEGVGYNRRLRIVKDVSFDQSCRGQVCYHLREKLIVLLESKGLWHDGMQIGNTGPRGVVLARAVDGRLLEMFRVGTGKRGEGEFLFPTLAASEKFFITPKEIEELAASVAKEAVLLRKIRAPS